MTETVPPDQPPETLTADQLATVLQEPKGKRAVLYQILQTLGQERCVALLAEALTCEHEGGMLTKDGRRKRTPGGIFFRLVKDRVTRAEHRVLFPRPPAPVPPDQIPMTWHDALALMPRLEQHPPGEASMKLTLVGRPGKIETKGQGVTFRLQGKPPGALPRGLPPVPNTPPLTWTVIVALRQWNRVKESFASNTDDQLIIEGYPVMQGEQHVLLAQSCTSVGLQRARKEAQQAATTTAEPTEDKG